MVLADHSKTGPEIEKLLLKEVEHAKVSGEPELIQDPF
jgi:hypothetical protein